MCGFRTLLRLGNLRAATVMAYRSVAGEACGVTSLSSAPAGRVAGILLVEIERLVIRLLVPHHLAEIALVDHSR
ncbi:hypothetical protein X744_32455 [Mesorhizobium sp. LNJC372A00]|nr:hypothetical protein X745_31815 [Mesorhizobium sp. LNJC374B00]ESY48092.1 hypothetical protein X744_32455 [Mesorhizobium sp. LNJC372A00]